MAGLLPGQMIAATAGVPAATGPTVTSMDPTTVTEVISYLEANGGGMPLGKVTRNFRGLKKAQLTEFFVLNVGDNPNDPVVSISELNGTQIAEAVARAKESGPTAGAPAKATASAPAEAAPLDAAKILEITAYLQAHGGALNLGKLSRQFRGVKKAQLESQFYIEIAEGHADFIVSLTPGGSSLIPPAAPRTATPAATAATGVWASADALATAPAAAAAPVQPLDALSIQKIALTLNEVGGAMSLGKLARTFPGLKKAQLEGHFEVITDSQHGPIVQVQGLIGGALTIPPPKKASKSGRSGAAATAGGGIWANATIMPTGGAGVQLTVPGTLQGGDVAAVEHLDAARLAEVQAFIAASGGSVSLGRLTRQFRGLKKAQLAPHFPIGQSDGEPDLIVTLPGGELTAAAPAPSRKRQRLEATADGQPASENLQMDAVKVAEVTAFLEASNGALTLGKVTRAFKGIKKAQLAQHFYMTITDNPQDPIVSVSEPNPAVLSELLLASSNKKARKGDAAKSPQEVAMMTGSFGPLF